MTLKEYFKQRLNALLFEARVIPAPIEKKPSTPEEKMKNMEDDMTPRSLRKKPKLPLRNKDRK